jgi:hypothetical protein
VTGIGPAAPALGLQAAVFSLPRQRCYVRADAVVRPRCWGVFSPSPGRTNRFSSSGRETTCNHKLQEFPEHATFCCRYRVGANKKRNRHAG